MKTYTCGKCDKPYASSQSLWNHKQRCNGGSTYENDDRKPTKADMIQSEDSMIQDEQEERIDRSEVLCGEIHDLIDKFIDENFPGL